MLPGPHLDLDGEVGEVHQVEKPLGDFLNAMVCGIAFNEITLRLTNTLNQRRRAVCSRTCVTVIAFPVMPDRFWIMQWVGIDRIEVSMGIADRRDYGVAP